MNGHYVTRMKMADVPPYGKGQYLTNGTMALAATLALKKRNSLVVTDTTVRGSILASRVPDVCSEHTGVTAMANDMFFGVERRPGVIVHAIIIEHHAGDTFDKSFHDKVAELLGDPDGPHDPVVYMLERT